MQKFVRKKEDRGLRGTENFATCNLFHWKTFFFFLFFIFRKTLEASESRNEALIRSWPVLYFKKCSFVQREETEIGKKIDDRYQIENETSWSKERIIPAAVPANDRVHVSQENVSSKFIVFLFFLLTIYSELGV